MALFDNNGRKNGIQIGTVGDVCIECRKKNRENEDYEPEQLDYKLVYKFWVNNLSHCMCLDCFKESLAHFVLLDPAELEPAKKPNNKKPNNKKEDKDGSKAAEPGEGK